MGPFQAIIASSIARFVPEWKCSYQQRATPQRLNCEKLDPMVVAYHCLSELVRICPFPSLTWRQLACIAQLWSIRTSRICPMPFMRWRQVYSSGTEGETSDLTACCRESMTIFDFILSNPLHQLHKIKRSDSAIST